MAAGEGVAERAGEDETVFVFVSRRAWVGRRAWPTAVSETVLSAGSVLVAAAATVVSVRAGIRGSSWTLLTSMSVTAVVGAFLAGRRPRHPVGWLLLATGLLFLVGQFADGLARMGLTHPPLGPGAATALWVDNWVYPPGAGAAVRAGAPDLS